MALLHKWRYQENMGWIIGAVLLAVMAVFAIALFIASRLRRRLAIEQRSARLKERVEQLLDLADTWLQISPNDAIAIELLRVGQESLDSMLNFNPRSGYAMQRQQDISEQLTTIADGSNDREPTPVLDSTADVPRLAQQLKTIKRILHVREHAGFLEAESFASYSVEIDNLSIRCALDTYIHFGERAMADNDIAGARKRFRQALETIRKADVLDKTIEGYFKRVSTLNNELDNSVRATGETDGDSDDSNSGRRSDPL